MTTHSSTLAWKIPWMEEPGGLQSMGSLRVWHDWATSLYFSLSCIGEGNGNPLQYSCLENPRDGGAWWAAIYGVAQSQTRLKQLSSSSSNEVKKRKCQLLSHVWLFLIPWTEASLLCPWNSPGRNAGVGSHSFLQGIFPTQGLNLGLPTLQEDSLPSELPGKG